MNRIRLLPEQVANQIAAGEVVERPASVVKELVENALDAKATRISVEIQTGGRSLIRITDDGIGMSRDDALLCLERHATSKITRAEDLSAIATMGFRGEALPSIASVSRFTLNTCERDGAIEGTEIIVNGGKIVSVKAGTSAPGTSVEVRQLFFNLPARRKFLRSEETESAHIQHYLTLAALAYPSIGFDFIKDGRMVWQLPAVKADDKINALRERLRALYGPEQKLLPVTFTGQLPIGNIDEEQAAEESAVDPTVKVWGVIGAPGVSRSTRDEQHVFVNRRPVENRGINFALLEGYHTALMKGRYPVCALFIELDASEVDVNIHPAKREVKFHHERAIRQLVADAVRKALLDFHSPSPLVVPASAGLSSKTDDGFDVAPAKAGTTNTALKLESQSPEAPKQEPVELPNFPKLSKPLPNWPAPQPKQTESPTAPLPPAQQPMANRQSSVPVPLLHVPLRLVGVIGKLYVILESDRGLVLLDQHAAHERILFEQMLQRMEQQEIAPSQRLLLPETVELAARDSTFLREQLPTLTRLGVGLSEFGERTFLLDALPPFVKVSEPKRFILELVDELKAAGQGVNTLRLGEHVIAKTVCRHAVKANDALAGPELENLIDDLRHCQMPYTCPHGRPTIIEMNFKELEKKFGRTV